MCNGCNCKKNRVVDYVPYQLCPKCLGAGFVTTYNFGLSTNSSWTNGCDVCGGAKIIPMHALAPVVQMPIYEPHRA